MVFAARHEDVVLQSRVAQKNGGAHEIPENMYIYRYVTSFVGYDIPVPVCLSNQKLANCRKTTENRGRDGARRNRKAFRKSKEQRQECSMTNMNGEQRTVKSWPEFFEVWNLRRERSATK